MRILVTESQYSNIIESYIQEQDLGLKGNTLAPKYAPPKEFGKSNPGGDAHTRNLVLGIATAFIPFVGPFISAGFGMADAKLYWDEGDKTSASLAAVFSLLPGVGGVIPKYLVSKPWVKKEWISWPQRLLMVKKHLPPWNLKLPNK